MSKIKNVFNKDRIRRTSFVALAFLLVVALVSNVYYDVSALESSPIKIANIKAAYDNAARAEHAAYKLYQCMNDEGGGVLGEGWWVRTNSSYNQAFKGDDGGIFYDEGWGAGQDIGLRSLSAGRWLEKAVQGTVDDGKIDCGDNKDHIIDVFASLIGKTRAQVMCNGDSPGLVKTKDGSSCGNTSAKYQKSGDWKSHLQELYDDYISTKEGYPVTWSKLSSNSFAYSEVDGYYLYVQDIEDGCGGMLSETATSTEAPSREHVATPLKFLDDYGNTTYRWYSRADDSALIESGFVEKADGWSCKQYIERANNDDLYGKFREIIHQKMGTACYEARKEQVEDAQRRFDEQLAGMTDEQKTENAEAIAKDQGILDTANGLLSSYSSNHDALLDPYQDDEGNHPPDNERGWMCKVIDGLADVGMEDYQIDTPDDELMPGTTESGPSCYDRAASLGWILCPIIEQVADAIQYIYEQIITPFLELDIGLFASDNATHDVWSKIRDMANIGFIIFFIFVIFSQLTGFGIDNYGIKKVLPKLIVGAILINLSYIICQLAVDLSNILGYGIKSVFEGLSPSIDSITVTQEGASGTGSTHSVAGTFILLIGIIAAICAAAILALGPHILIPVFMGLISIIIAIIFAFILLAVRKAFAVLLVIVSPLAFMCYILPNTKSLFDKWFSAFKGVLLAFPICSAMIYGGQFVGSLLIDAAGASNVPFTLALCAAVISIMPVFMIPKVLRSSMAAISGGLARMQGAITGRARGAAGARLAQSSLMNKQRYRQQARAAKSAARQSAYNAKKGQRYLTRQQNKGNADLTKMSPAARAAYLNAQGNVDAQDKSEQEAWSTKFSEMEGGDAARAAELGRLASTGKLDKNSLIAGLGSIKDADQLTAAFSSIHGSEAGRALLADSKVRGSVADTMKAGDGIINQSMGKVLGKMSSEEVSKTTPDQFKAQVAKKVQEAGTGVMASQNKDVFNTAGAAGYFSSEQLAAGIGAGYSGANATSFNKMVSGMDETKRAQLASQLSASNASNFTGESLAAVGGVDVEGAAAAAGKEAMDNGVTDKAELDRVTEEARDAALQKGMDAGAEVVKSNAPGAIETLNSEDGARLRANMYSNVKEALGVTGDSGSEAAPPENPDNGGGDSGGGGGWKDDNGNPITSPAQLTDDDLAYANKLREMSQRGSSDGSTLSVDHAPSAGPSEAPAMRGEHGRGINDNTGKERAAEGNRFDYHPKREGESNADYSARAKWEKEMTALGEKAGPRREIIETNGNKRLETHQEWQARAGITSFDAWRGKSKS